MTQYINIGGLTLSVVEHRAIVVGSGAAGLNCADLLAGYGVDVCVVTEGMSMGTSRNTGSDKQTYYKLTMSGGASDSVYDMARTLFDGGSMHGDIALTEAANSARAFIRLCELGVPFPANEYGEYVGYRTDHDPRSRATSCGPLTSRYMTEALERSVLSKRVPIYDGCRVTEIITDGGRVAGVICIGCENEYNRYGLAYFRCDSLVYAVGGPSAIYASTVYPESQTCALGTAFLAGVDGVNLTESQYGIASVAFRWNLSGSYQQVIPRYFTTDGDGGDMRELICDGLCDKIFLKGYQWPFDPRKVGGSSDIDMAVYRERQSGRRVFMDFTRNPADFGFDRLSVEAKEYLLNCGAVQSLPIERLLHMNRRAYELYLSHGIDLAREPLEINVCAQHNNGGLLIDSNYETNIGGLYAVGECAGVFGVCRPGGSALNSTQVSSMRAAKHIASQPICDRVFTPEKIAASRFIGSGDLTLEGILARRRSYGEIMDRAGAFKRNSDEVRRAIDRVKAELDGFDCTSDDAALIREIGINHDILVTQYMYLSAIEAYMAHGGKSRGSYIIDGDSSTDSAHSSLICRMSLRNGMANAQWERVRPIPASEQWFEKVYNSAR